MLNLIRGFILSLVIAASPALAGSMSLLGAGKPGTVAAAYSGPLDVVSANTFAWWGMRAASLAKAGTKVANVCNAADANCADVNSLANGNFDVSTAQGSPLNCGGAGGTCTIKTLYDQSGQTNCTTACDLTQATIANRPTLVFSCSGSLACMAFSLGSSQFLQSANMAGFASMAQASTMSAVGVRTAAFTTQQMLITTNNGAFDIYWAAAANMMNTYAGAVQSVNSIADSSIHAIQWVINGASSVMYIDGSSNAVSSGAQTINASNPWVMGAQQGPANPLTGKIFEAGVWANVGGTAGFSGTEQSNMNSNQHTYWGF